MGKRIENLVDDIYTTVSYGTEITDEDCGRLGKRIAKTLQNKLSERTSVFYLRMSGIGDCEKKQWYLSRNPDPEEIKPDGPTYLKFMIGDITEDVILWLAELSGHEVTNEQLEVEIEGVKGHIDSEIDNELVDVKSASKYSFEKFKEGEKLYFQDSFGYLDQISGYAAAMGHNKAHFLVMNKETGEICLDTYTHLKTNTAERIKYLKEVLENEEPPERPYGDVPDGKSGNRKLPFKCDYCPFKKECWSDVNEGKGLRTFIYSNGARHLTKVEREPKVEEV